MKGMSTAESHADALVAQIRRGRTDHESVLRCLRASGRPYFTWALAWSAMIGAVERNPADEDARVVLRVLEAVEPAVSVLDGQTLLSGSPATGSAGGSGGATVAGRPDW
jgi:hypothetical protein